MKTILIIAVLAISLTCINSTCNQCDLGWTNLYGTDGYCDEIC